jgi:hypothetical protein
MEYNHITELNFMAQIMYTYVLNEKIICVETVSGIGGRE